MAVLATLYTVFILAGVLGSVRFWTTVPTRSKDTDGTQTAAVVRARQAVTDQGAPADPLPGRPVLDGRAALGCFGVAFAADWLTQAALRRTGELAGTGLRAVIDAMVITSVAALILQRVGPRTGVVGLGLLPLCAAVALGILGAGTVGL